MIAWGGTPLGAALGGLLAERLDVGIAIVVCSGGTLVGLLVALLTSLRDAPRLAILVDAMPDVSGDTTDRDTGSRHE
jgi:hypothetical protein